MAKFCDSILFIVFIDFIVAFIHGFELERYYVPTQENFVAHQSALFHHKGPDASLFGFPSPGQGYDTSSASASAASSSAFSFGLGTAGLNNQFFGGAFGLGFGFGGGWFPTPLIPGIGQVRPSDVNVPTLLKPSDSGWDTSYNVPCGSYRIRPFVIANLRLGTSSSPLYGRRLKRSVSDVEDMSKQSERSYFPYFPVKEPRSCSWDFNSDGPCKLKFKCVWFQLPALFSCTENYLLVSDSTANLNSTFCGNRKPRKVYNSSNGKLILTFRSQTSSLPAVFDCAVTCTLEAPANGPGSTDSTDDKPQSPSKFILSQVKEVDNNASSTTKLEEKPRMRIGNCKCGVQDGLHPSRGRIVGGTSSYPAEFPWVAALVKKSSTTSISTRPFCAGSLISDRYVITAAHCVLNNKIIREPRSITGGNSSPNSLRNPKDFFDVLLIEHDINHLDEVQGGTIRVAVDKIIVHPNYDNVTFHFDVALLRLEKSIDFGSDLSNYQYNTFDFHSERRRRLFNDIEARSTPRRPIPICLPHETDLSLEDNYGIITGWGLQTEGGIPSDTLMKATVQIFNDTKCQELYKEYNYPVTSSMICAGYLKGKIDSCVGDSGGGLAIQESNRYYLAGITSWGRGCGRKKQPGVYSNLKTSGLIEWIRSEASDGVWCV